MTSRQKEYRALVGMDFKNPNFVEGEDDESDREVRVEAGDKIEGMPEDELRHQLNEGNAEVWKERKTENVKRLDSVPVQVSGVLSRHANEGADIVLTDARVKQEERGDE